MKCRALLVSLLFATVSALAGTTATITGTATRDSAPVAGAVVTISSGAMQGTRSTTTDVNGRYAFIAVPPGEYSVSFAIAGAAPASIIVRAGVGQTTRADAKLRSENAEASTGSVPATVATEAVQSNIEESVVDLLPVGRDPFSVVALAGGTNGRSISGGTAVESLWLIDGASINDPGVRNPLQLFVEDAIEETTLLTAAIPAEYGRFNGGVVNSVTRSGGNNLSGSFRDSFSNPSWTAPSKYQNISNTDKLSQTFEATLGGSLLTDRLWFFAAGRRFSNVTQKFYTRSPSYGFTQTSLDRRWQLKLTGQPAASQSLFVSATEFPRTDSNICIGTCAEPSTIDPSRQVKTRIATARYTAMLSDRIVGEAYWSGEKTTFENAGGDVTDSVNGTLGVDTRTNAMFGAPAFCGVCDSERRTGTNLGLKSSFYLPTRRLGTHVVSGGYDRWGDDQVANNYQSGSGFIIYTFSRQQYNLHPGDVFHPKIAAGDLITWYPIPLRDRPSAQKSDGVFVNDRWDFGENWSFNLGARYDRNDYTDGAIRVSDAASLQPRLAAAWDMRGDGRYRVNASYSRYTDRLTPSLITSSSQAGAPNEYDWKYKGPTIEGLPTREAFEQLFAWFNSQCDSSNHCGTDNMAALYWAGAASFSTKINAPLKSTDVDEKAIGFSIATGRSGYVRVDAVMRDWSHFLVARVTRDTGQTTDAFGNAADWNVIENNDAGLQRRYRGVTIQGTYRITPRWNAGGNYTWSKTTGNTAPNGMYPVVGPDYYPELMNFPRNNPKGYVADDRRHKARLWLSTDVPTRAGVIDFSLLESYDSGTPYSTAGSISTAFDEDSISRYAMAPTEVYYYFSGRGALRWDDVTSTDVGIRYELPLLRTAGVFVDFTVANVFNESAQIGGDTYVSTQWNESCRQTADPTKPCALFNPFTETPVEGVHYVLSPTFGQATSPSHYQTPRTYSFSAGMRF